MIGRRSIQTTDVRARLQSRHSSASVFIRARNS